MDSLTDGAGGAEQEVSDDFFGDAKVKGAVNMFIASLTGLSSARGELSTLAATVAGSD